MLNARPKKTPNTQWQQALLEECKQDKGGVSRLKKHYISGWFLIIEFRHQGAIRVTI